MDIGAEGTDGPTIAIAEACEGIEAAALSIRSGDISIVCTDDCLNAANFDLANYDSAINISGGTIVAYTTAGDGFDSLPLQFPERFFQAFSAVRQTFEHSIIYAFFARFNQFFSKTRKIADKRRRAARL